MSDLTTEGVMLGLCGPDYAGGLYNYDLETKFKEWLSELIRKEREEAWDVGHMQGISDRDAATRDGNYWEVPVTDNPYRKEQP